MSRLTIYDIAKLTGVSITTVSRVLNDSPNVNEQTRKKIKEVLQKRGFVPRQKARNFNHTDFYAIGLLMEDIRHAYLSELAYAINQELGKWRVNTILCNIADVEKEFITQIDNLIEKHVNGVILLGSIFENDICKAAIERRYPDFPFVTVNANLALPNVYEVMQDQFQGTKDAVRYLYQREKKRIGWIFYNHSHSDQKKIKGFLAGMRECGLDSNRQYEVQEKSLTAGKNATAKLLELYPDTDSIIYSGDIMAVGGVHYLNERNISIPNQISVIGFNNSSCSKQCSPPLTSVDNKIYDSGKCAAQLIIDVLNRQTPENVLLQCGLEIRKSTD